MKRILVFVALSAVLLGHTFGQAKWGGIARHIAMGGASAGQGIVLNPYLWEDPAYILVNPAYQAMYKDYFWTNIGGGTLAGLTTADNGYGLQNAGINFAIDKEWAAGVVLSFDPSFVNTTSGLLQGVSVIGGGVGGGSIMQRPAQIIPPVQMCGRQSYRMTATASTLALVSCMEILLQTRVRHQGRLS